jgi:hypothetical protein
MFAGRRFGKTDGAVYRIYRSMARRPGLYWWVGLTWRSASMKRAWRLTHQIARRILAAQGLPEREHVNRSNYEIRLPGMGEIWFRTGDNPASLAGEGIMGAVVDEFSLMGEAVWTEYLEATLLDHGGWAAFVGVPKGNNWAANLWRAAGTREGWLQLHATSYDNPFIPAERIDAVKANAPERFFNQEYLAQIVDDAGMVFRRVADAATATEQKPEAGHQYVVGVDWGKSNDFTVLKVLDAASKTEVYSDRFNQIDYAVQRGRLMAVCERYKPSAIIAESNSMGEPIIEQLQRDGLPVMGFNTTNATKAAAIEALALAFERGDITILNDPTTVAELQAYEIDRTPRLGMLRYGAPEGMHDDCVMALALAWQGVEDSGPLLLWSE